MLGKLFKYEWKSVSLLLVIMHGALLVYTLIGRMGYELFLSGYTGGTFANSLNIIVIFYFIVYVVAIIAVALLTILYLAMRVQKNLFADEGYLTHTLPVTPAKILWSKVFIIWLWSALDIIVVSASVILLIGSKETFPSITTGFSHMWRILASVSGFSDFLNSAIYTLELIVQFFCYDTLLLIFAICLGSLFKNHKVLGTVVSFFGLTILSNIVMLIITGQALPGGFTSVVITTPAGSSTQMTGGPTNYIYLISIAWYLIASVLFFFGSKYILTRKLNLE